MNRKIRGLEDREAQERKSLLRDVRRPGQVFVDAFRNGTMQLAGVWGAGVCLFLFPIAATPLFVIGLLFFVLRCLCVGAERLPFRMPMGVDGVDRGDPLPGRRGYAKPEGIYCLIAKIPRIIMREIFAGSFAKKRGFSLTHGGYAAAKPLRFL